jgi:hypothetical protein
MKRLLARHGLLILVAALPTFAQRVPLPPSDRRPDKQDKVKLPDLVLKAQFVVVLPQRTAELGQQPDPLDYQTVADVEAAVHKWGRYRLVMRVEDADLIFSVRRTGGIAMTGGVPRGDASSSTGDYLAVFNARFYSSGGPGPAFWRATQRDGLARGKMSLLKALQEDIETSAAARNKP